MSRECPLCHEPLGRDAPEAATVSEMAGGGGFDPCIGEFRWVKVATPWRPAPLYRVVWGRGPTFTLPMPWPAVLRFVAAARKARPQYPIEVVAVPLSPTHPEEPRP